MKTILLAGSSDSIQNICSLLDGLETDNLLLAQDGHSARNIIKSNVPDIAILDMDLGDMSAVQLIGAEQENPIRFYILAGRFDKYRPDILLARQEGLHFILLSKPVKEYGLNLILRRTGNYGYQYCTSS